MRDTVYILPVDIERKKAYRAYTRLLMFKRGILEKIAELQERNPSCWKRVGVIIHKGWWKDLPKVETEKHNTKRNTC